MTTTAGRLLFDLAGRHALVIGAPGPLQRACAMTLAEAGADVSLATLHDDASEHREALTILEQCHALGRQGGVRSVDLVNYEAVEAVVDDLEGSIAPIDILANATHEANIVPTAELTVSDWHREIDRNATSMFNATSCVGKRMLERGYGRIITLVSIIATRGVPNCAVFGASQGAMLGFVRSLGVEWARRGVTVNALGVGFLEDVPGPHRDPELATILERYIPLRRLGSPADLRGALLYLASEEASFVVSEEILVDGAIYHHA